MVPVSWCEMQCPQTYLKEYRKVAKVQPEFLSSLSGEQSTKDEHGGVSETMQS